MHVRRFTKLAKRVFGVTPGQLVAKARIDEAARLLAETDRTIAEIALECGYCDHSAFARQFRAATSLTPSQYRSVGSASDQKKRIV
jgi:AraC-like DNA-binding protein